MLSVFPENSTILFYITANTSPIEHLAECSSHETSLIALVPTSLLLLGGRTSGLVRGVAWDFESVRTHSLEIGSAKYAPNLEGLWACYPGNFEIWGLGHGWEERRRTADIFPVVPLLFFGGTTANTSVVRRLNLPRVSENLVSVL